MGAGYEYQRLFTQLWSNLLNPGATRLGNNKERSAQGKDTARQFLREHPELAADIEQKIRAIVGTHTAGPVSADEDELPEEAEA